MRNKKILIAGAVAAVLTGLYTQPLPAANIAVTNVALKYASAGRLVWFDVSWDASWRALWTDAGGTSTNWDAAWIFVKYRPAGSTSGWSHATLSTNNGDHVAPAGSTINVGLSTNAGGTNFGVGVFLYRSENGSGSWTNAGVKLRWRYADDGVAGTARVDVCVQAIEMVHVPQGSFYLGDGAKTSLDGQFEDGTNGQPFLVTNENYTITLGGGADGSLGNNNATAMSPVDDFNDTNTTAKTLPASFPKGYSAFYCMKYEISQGQYADFLNQLAYIQATNRYPNSGGSFRHTISGSYPAYTSSAPTRACNWLTWVDGAAYADWAGLRPITELEHEKACRGPLYPVTNEYAWGNTTQTQITNFFGVDGSGTETALPASANICFNSSASVQGPVRCGIYATTNSSRQAAGASYWGIMDLSGNVCERPVTVGNTTGREFTGTHGNGTLTSEGNADVPTWPLAGAKGAGGMRGGSWNLLLPARASSRYNAAYSLLYHVSYTGWRAGRSAP